MHIYLGLLVASPVLSLKVFTLSDRLIQPQFQILYLSQEYRAQENADNHTDQKRSALLP